MVSRVGHVWLVPLRLSYAKARASLGMVRRPLPRISYSAFRDGKMTNPAGADEQKQRPHSAADDSLRLLMLAAAGGCNTSFAELYEQTHRRVFGIVLRIVRHRAEAEEVLQDIYVKVWSRSMQFDASRGLVIHWLAGIAQRAAIDTMRRASSRPREVGDGPDDTDPYGQLTSPDSGPSEDFEQSEKRRMVDAQLSTLPLDQRESLVLAFFDGLTHPEIAAKLACPLGTIKSRIRRALMTLRPLLQATQ